MPLVYRPATLADVAPMHRVRLAVKENPLNNPLLVTPAHYVAILQPSGAGWVALLDDEVVGFAIVDTPTQNVWALFVHPAAERQGIGRQLFGRLEAWAVAQSLPYLWLSTAPGTRAEAFYAAAGWSRTGLTSHGEVRFERRWPC